MAATMQLRGFSATLSIAALQVTDQERLDQLESAVQVIRDYNDDLVGVVLWALGTAVVLVFGFFGFNLFQSARQLRNERASLRDELLARLEVDVAELRAQLTERTDESLESLRASVDGSSRAAIFKVLAPINATVTQLQRDMTRLRLESHESRAERSLESGSGYSALTNAIRLLDTAIDEGHRITISEAIDLLGRAVDLLEASNTKLDAYALSELQTCLGRLGEAHQPSRIAFEERIARLQRGDLPP